MTVRRDPDAILAAWLEEGPDVLPEATRRAIEVTTRTTHQARRLTWLPWRATHMNGMTRLALAAAAVVAVAVGGLYLFRPATDPSGGVGGPGSPAPSASPSSSPAPSASGALLDTTTWVTYESRRYGFSIDRPDDWTQRPSTRDWTFEPDAADWLSPAQESFISAPGEVRVSAWSVAVEPGTSAEAWIQAYCESSADSATEVCPSIQDGAVPVVVDQRPAVLFLDPGWDPQAFILNGDRMHVVVVWRGEDDPSVRPFGGARRLLESFLSTMVLGAPEATSAPPS